MPAIGQIARGPEAGRQLMSSLFQPLQERLGLHQIASVESFRERFVERHKKVTCPGVLVLIDPQPGQ
jgi:hypothetical protein